MTGDDREDDDGPKVPFTGSVRRSHAMEPGSVVLVLERYAGDIEVGDTIVVVSSAGEMRAKVATLAWGSSFGHEAPPLTLVVKGLDGSADYAAASLVAAS